MVFTILFFGASSSQAVHPERMSAEDLQAAAVGRILASSRDLVLASSRAGGALGQSRNHFALAKEKIDKHEFVAALAAINKAILAVAQPTSPLAVNLRDGFDFLVAACSAEQAGIDTRQPQDIYEAAAGDMGEEAGAFDESWKALRESLRHADPTAVTRLSGMLTAMHAPQKAVEVLKGA